MKIYYPLPLLSISGGIKVVIQHSHMLNEAGYECIVITPTHYNNPYPNYNFAKFSTWNEVLSNVNFDDIFVFNWLPDFDSFKHLNNRMIFFSQGVINKVHNHDLSNVLNKRMELWTISKHSRDFYFYGYNTESHIVNNWINTEIFSSDTKNIVKDRVGMIDYRTYYNEELANKLVHYGFSLLKINGSENDVANMMRTCDYFVSATSGVYNGHDHAEGFPLPGAEAMACGAILITYNNNGCYEYSFNKVNSYMTEEQTSENLILKLLEAKGSLYKEKIRSNGIFTIEQKFNKNIILNQIKRGLRL